MNFRLMKKRKVEEYMSSKERYLAALNDEPIDRIPVGSPTSVATIEQMKKTGSFFPEAHYEPKAMVNLAIAAHTILGYDAVMPHFSVWIGAATLGSSINWGNESMMPDAKRPLWNNPTEITIPNDIANTEPARALLEGIRKLNQEYPDICVIGKAMGPWTLSCHVFGTENFLKKTITAPNEVTEALNKLSVFSERFGKLQIEAGAHALCIPDHVTGDMVSPKTYTKFLMPVHKKLIKKFEEHKVPLILHCCGDTLDRIEYFEQAGWPAYHIESKVDAFEAKKRVRKMKLIGNINNPTTLWSGSPEQVKKEALYAARAGFEILAPECAIPTSVSDRNLSAIVDVATHLNPIETNKEAGKNFN